jgi:hypothetical protein
MTEPIWYNDFTGFITEDNFYKILPFTYMSFEEKLNAIMRFCLYLSIVLSLITVNAKYIGIVLVAAILSYVFYSFETRDKTIAENFLKDKNLEIVDNKLCTRTTIENPFMNPSIADIKYNPDRPAACDIEKVKDKVESNFKKRVYKDVNDIFGREYSSREFYTVPSTTIPNDQGGFAKWLYGSPATCKEGNGLECKRNTYRYILR